MKALSTLQRGIAKLEPFSEEQLAILIASPPSLLHLPVKRRHSHVEVESSESTVLQDYQPDVVMLCLGKLAKDQRACLTCTPRNNMKILVDTPTLLVAQERHGGLR